MGDADHASVALTIDLFTANESHSVAMLKTNWHANGLLESGSVLEYLAI